jgi:phage shock protein PspC (stress-responsive transcriptional regulator)
MRASPWQPAPRSDPKPKWGVFPMVCAARQGKAGTMKLSRPREGRLIAGVCAAIARRFGWRPTTVRLLTVLSLLLPGPQVVIYIVLWILIPQDPS